MTSIMMKHDVCIMNGRNRIGLRSCRITSGLRNRA